MNKKDLTEYKNTTNYSIWVEQGGTVEKNGKPKLVKPDKSVFLTKYDIDRQVEEQEYKVFLDGSLRKASSVKDLKPHEVKIRDDMSEYEIELVVKDLNSTHDLANKMRTLTSISTVNRVMEECEKQDKPISMLKSCLRKLNTLQEDIEIRLKNLARDERKKESKFNKSSEINEISENNEEEVGTEE